MHFQRDKLWELKQTFIRDEFNFVHVMGYKFPIKTEVNWNFNLGSIGAIMRDNSKLFIVSFYLLTLVQNKK